MLQGLREGLHGMEILHFTLSPQPHTPASPESMPNPKTVKLRPLVLHPSFLRSVPALCSVVGLGYIIL